MRRSGNQRSHRDERRRKKKRLPSRKKQHGGEERGNRKEAGSVIKGGRSTAYQVVKVITNIGTSDEPSQGRKKQAGEPLTQKKKGGNAQHKRGNLRTTRGDGLHPPRAEEREKPERGGLSHR